MTCAAPFRKGLLLVVLCAALWSLTPLIVMFVSTEIDAHTQNALRYFSGGVVMLALSLSMFREDLKASLKAWRPLLGGLFFMVFYQTFYIMGISLLLPTTAALVARSSVVWTIVSSLLVFPEERAYIRRPLYLLGMILALAGVTGVILFKHGLGTGRVNLGIIYGLLGAIGWSLYNIYTQKHLRRYNPAAFTPLLFLAGSPIFLGFAFKWGDPGALLSASPKVLAALIISGVLCIGIAQAIYYYAIRLTGVAMASGVTLITPFLTAAGSYFLFDDRITLRQWLAALMLAGGIYASALSKRRSSSQPAPPLPGLGPRHLPE